MEGAGAAQPASNWHDNLQRYYDREFQALQAAIRKVVVDVTAIRCFLALDKAEVIAATNSPDWTNIYSVRGALKWLLEPRPLSAIVWRLERWAAVALIDGQSPEARILRNARSRLDYLNRKCGYRPYGLEACVRLIAQRIKFDRRRAEIDRQIANDKEVYEIICAQLARKFGIYLNEHGQQTEPPKTEEAEEPNVVDLGKFVTPWFATDGRHPSDEQVSPQGAGLRYSARKVPPERLGQPPRNQQERREQRALATKPRARKH